MKKNNDFDNDSRRPDLNEYLSKEVTQYYGEDIINDIKNSSAPLPPKHRRKNRIISALGVCCAVMFLTGAVIFSGVFFTSGIPVFGSDVTGSTSQSVESDTSENIVPNITDTDNFIISSSIDTDSNIPENKSSNIDTSENSADSDIDTNTMDTHGSVTPSSTDTDSNILENKSLDTDTSENSADSDIDTNTTDTHGSVTSSSIDTDNNILENKSSDTDTSGNSADSDIDTNTTDTQGSVTSSSIDTDSNIHENKSSNTDTSDRQSYFSLPEYPEEGNISAIDTDVNNNSDTNPYDNVTTGKRVRAGVGISLMILSLITAFILNKFNNNKEF